MLTPTGRLQKYTAATHYNSSLQPHVLISKALAEEKKLEPQSHAQASLEFEKNDRMENGLVTEVEGTAAAPNPYQLAVQLIITRSKSVIGEKV